MITYRRYRIKSLAYMLGMKIMVVLSAGMVYAGPKGAVGDLYVACEFSNSIVQIDSTTGAVVGDFVTTGLDAPFEARFGPNGDLFVVNMRGGTVTEHDSQTGAFIKTFISGLNVPSGLRFKPNGNLLVYQAGANSITEFDSMGNFIGISVTNLGGDSAPLDFGPDGNLYVSDFFSGLIQRFDPNEKNLGTFASGGGLNGPESHDFGPNGNLFVSSANTNQVIEYDGITGETVGTFIRRKINNPTGLTFSPDGHLWISSFITNDLDEFDGTSGAWIRTISGFSGPMAITVKPEPGPADYCLTMTVSTLTSGQNASWNISGATAGATFAVVYGLQPGSTIVNGQLGFCATFGIQAVTKNNLVGTAVADGAGNASINKVIPNQAIGLTILTQAAEKGTCPDECMSGVDTQVVQ